MGKIEPRSISAVGSTRPDEVSAHEHGPRHLPSLSRAYQFPGRESIVRNH